MPPAPAIAYGRLVAAELVSASSGLLRAVYLHGSAALGGWQPHRSDVDMLVITADGIGAAALGEVADVLVATSAGCPGRGLECSVVTASHAAAPGPPWPFLLHVVSGPGEPGGSRVVHGVDSGGDADLLMHYAVCRAAGLPVYGPPPQKMIGPIPRGVILSYLAAECGWGLAHAPEAYAVLNACRAMIYLTEGQIVSKLAGGRTALRLGIGPASVLEHALAQQLGLEPDRAPGREATDFVLATAAALQTAAQDQ
jgi:hypothetical protein